jgi:hypothetical protein
MRPVRRGATCVGLLVLALGGGCNAIIGADEMQLVPASGGGGFGGTGGTGGADASTSEASGGTGGIDASVDGGDAGGDGGATGGTGGGGGTGGTGGTDASTDASGGTGGIDASTDASGGTGGIDASTDGGLTDTAGDGPADGGVPSDALPGDSNSEPDVIDANPDGTCVACPGGCEAGQCRNILEAIGYPLVCGAPQSLVNVGNAVYATSSFGLLSFDISNPAAILLTDARTTPDSAVDIAAIDITATPYLLVANRSYDAGSLIVYNASAPGQPLFTAARNMAGAPNYVTAATIGGQPYAFVATSTQAPQQRVEILGLSDPKQPVPVKTIDGIGGSDALAIAPNVGGKVLLFATGGPWNSQTLVIEDVTNVTSPLQVYNGSIGSNFVMAKAFTVNAGTPLLLVHDGTKVIVFDVTQPNSPSQVGTLSLHGSNAYYVDIRAASLGGTFYAFTTESFGTGVDGLHMWDLSNVASPQHPGSFALTRAKGLAQKTIGGTPYMFVGAGYGIDVNSALVAVNLTQPTALAEAGRFALKDALEQSTVAYVSGKPYVFSVGGPHVYGSDVSSPSSAQFRGELTAFTSASSVASFTVGATPYLVVSDSQASPNIRIVNIADPANPSVVTSLNLADQIYTVTTFVVGGKPYALARGHVLDLSQPTAPVQVGSVTLDGFRSTYADINGSQFVLTAGSELFITRVDSPSSPSLVGHYSVASESVAAVSGIATIAGATYVTVVTSAGSIGAADHVRVVDVSVPASPVVVGGVDIPGGDQRCGVAVLQQGSRWYAITASAYGVHVVDITTPSVPKVLETFATSASGYDVDLLTVDTATFAVTTGFSALGIFSVAQISP